MLNKVKMLLYVIIAISYLFIVSYSDFSRLQRFLVLIFRVTRECFKTPPFLRGPEKVIDFDGHVIGMAIDPQGRYLYVNVRTWVSFG
jgi:hypothetical protein